MDPAISTNIQMLVVIEIIAVVALYLTELATKPGARPHASPGSSAVLCA